MENQENSNYTADMLKQINQTIISLCQNQTMLFEQYKALSEKINIQYEILNKKMDEQYEVLNKKMDEQYEALNKKMDEQYEALNKKMDEQYEENRTEHIEMKNMIAAIQKDVKDLRTDVDIVYDLEKDSRDKIKHLL